MFDYLDCNTFLKSYRQNPKMREKLNISVVLSADISALLQYLLAIEIRWDWLLFPQLSCHSIY